jgi:hypothetical protein
MLISELDTFMKAKTLAMLASIILVAALSGCKPVNPNDLPVSHWADPATISDGYGDACSVASAKAILAAGLPFPNYGTRDQLAPDGKTSEKRITTVDYWMGGTRFVFPAELASDSGGYPDHNPNRYRELHGSLPHFYPKGELAPNIDGMGSRVDVLFECSMEPDYAASWGKGYRSNDDGIQKVKVKYEKELTDDTTLPGTVTVSIREDLGMTEVLLDRGHEFNGQRFWQASYWPLHKSMNSLDGGVSGIGCETRNDPAAKKRYGGRGWTCTSSLSVTPNVSASIRIYVSHIEEMPNVYEQVKQVVIHAKQAGEK